MSLVPVCLLLPFVAWFRTGKAFQSECSYILKVEGDGVTLQSVPPRYVVQQVTVEGANSPSSRHLIRLPKYFSEHKQTVLTAGVDAAATVTQFTERHIRSGVGGRHSGGGGGGGNPHFSS